MESTKASMQSDDPAGLEQDRSARAPAFRLPSTRRGWQHSILLVAAAVALCTIFGSRAVPTFRSYRVKVLTAPRVPVSGGVGVRVPPLGQPRLEPPFALIARVRNLSGGPLHLSLAVDGSRVCEVVAGPGDRRIDCAVSTWDPRITHSVSASAAGQSGVPWTLTYLEIATHHGATRHYDLVIVPGIRSDGGVPAWWILPLFLLLTGLAFVASPELPRSLALAHTVVVVLIAILLALVWFAPLVSQFRVLLSPRLFLALVGLLYLPRIWIAGAWLLRGEAAAPLRRAAVLVIVALLVLAVYGAVVERMRWQMFDGNYSGFLRISAEMFDRNPILNQRSDVRRSLALDPGGGYDGQFMYFEAFDPLLMRYRSDPATYRLFIDAPPYRFGRIGFSWLTVLFSGGRPLAFPAVMMWLLLGSLAGTAALLGIVGKPQAAVGCLAVLVPGFWQSVQLGLPEPVAAFLLLGGFLLLRHEKVTLAAVVFALSIMVRETGAILVLALVAGMAWRKEWRNAATVAVLAFAPYAAWRLFVGWVLMPDWGMQGFWMDVKNVGIPMAGLAHLLSLVMRGEYYPKNPEVARAAVYFSALLVGGFAVALWAAVRVRTAPAIAAVAYGALALSLTYDSIWVHVGNGQRGSFELFLALAIVTAMLGRASKNLKIALGIFWVASAGYIFYGGFDAELIRLTFIA